IGPETDLEHKMTLQRAIVMGTSAGGLKALSKIFSHLPKHYSLPILVVQHMAAHTKGCSISTLLADYSHLPILEADDKTPIQPGCIYFAPPGYHLLVESDHTLALSIDPKVNHSRPSIDVLFETAADVYQQGLIGVLLTGASQDGTQGLKKILQRGGMTLVQDPQTAEAPLMPRFAIAVRAASQVLTLEAIAQTLIQFGSRPHA
ncbi:MAG: chemotaxis protein CheB, partial [Magnetococcus sp. YQC-5]